MATRREVLETIERGISCMVYYANAGKDRDARGLMTSEVGAMARRVASWRNAGSLPHQVEAGLVARYGYVEGRNLSAEFARAFDEGKAPAVTPVRRMPSLARFDE